MTERRPEMRLAGAAGPEQQDVRPFLQPCIAAGKRRDMGMADHGNGGEGEAAERLARRQACLQQMLLDAPLGIGVSPAVFLAHPPDLQSRPLMDMDFATSCPLVRPVLPR